MKKRFLRTSIVAYLLMICMLWSAFFAQALEVSAQTRYQPTESLTELIRAVEALESATRAHYKTADTYKHAARYIRTGRYSDVRWQMLVGTIDPAYETAMQPYAALRNTNNVILLTDQSGLPYTVDIPHMAAVIDSGRDFAGWAGDLITLADEIGSLLEAQQMIANENGTCSLPDIHANIDALNLCVLAEQNGGSLSRAMRTYYIDGGAEKAVTTFLLRETGLTEAEFGIDAIEAAFAVRLNSTTCDRETLALENAYGVADSLRLKYANRAFATWLYQTYCDESVGHEMAVVFRSAPTCVRAGYLCKVCRHCGKPVQQALDVLPAHHFSETRTEPTETEPGMSYKICRLCNHCETVRYDDLQAGDADLDGTLTARDYLYIKCGVLGSRTLTPRQQYLADLNRDGAVDAEDCLLFRGMLLCGFSCLKDRRF